MTFQRVVQTLSFVCFIILLWSAAFPLMNFLPVDAFFRLDPVVFMGGSLSARMLTPFFWTTVLILVLTAVLGRFFCGTICPMGTTIDITDRLMRAKNKKSPKTLSPELKPVKYQVLLFILGAAFMGISLVFIASPLALTTRFYGLIIYPVLCLLGNHTIAAVRPLANYLEITSIVYTQVPAPRFDLQWFTFIFFVLIFAFAVYAPRFWCRYLCPSGAIFALVSKNPLVRRQVASECNQCGRCQKKCPMQAIGSEPWMTNHGECIVCLTCVKVCPEKAVRFKKPSGQKQILDQKVSQGRRKFIHAGIGGTGAAFIALTSLKHPRSDIEPGNILIPKLIRPPGAVPEKDFLARCIRCGQCMKACPTNTLQPMGPEVGFASFYSPIITPRRGPCKPLCNVCGQVCPTGAIRALTASEKIWAKVGTAHILRHKCLAWEFGKKCLICDESCAYNAVEFKMTPGIPVAVPFINENKYSGCGSCEHNCPVQARAAIIVEPMGSLRLKTGSYQQQGREIGLVLELTYAKRFEPSLYQQENKDSGEPGLPPGFTE